MAVSSAPAVVANDPAASVSRESDFSSSLEESTGPLIKN